MNTRRSFVSLSICLSCVQALRRFQKKYEVQFDTKVHNIKGSIVMVGISKDPYVSHLQKAIKICDQFPEGQCHLHLLARTIPEYLKNYAEGLGPKFTFANTSNSDAVFQDLHDAWTRPKGSTAWMKKRTNKLALLRNAALTSAIEQHPDAKYIVMTDLDGIIRWDSTTQGAIAQAFKPTVLAQWDAITFTSTNYYDWWAVRCSGISKFIDNDPKRDCVKKAEEDPESLIPIDSAFNGMEILKVDSIGDCKYGGAQPPDLLHGAIVCEHVPMNLCLVEKGKKVLMSGTKMHTGGLHQNDVSFAGGKYIDPQFRDPYEDHYFDPEM